MRSGIFIRLLATPMMWVIVVFGVLFFIRFYRLSIAASVQDNLALYLGVALGAIVIVMSALSPRSRVQISAQTLIILTVSFIPNRVQRVIVSAVGPDELFCERFRAPRIDSSARLHRTPPSALAATIS
jgi:hypothetical protein